MGARRKSARYDEGLSDTSILQGRSQVETDGRLLALIYTVHLAGTRNPQARRQVRRWPLGKDVTPRSRITSRYHDVQVQPNARRFRAQQSGDPPRGVSPLDPLCGATMETVARPTAPREAKVSLGSLGAQLCWTPLGCSRVATAARLAVRREREVSFGSAWHHTPCPPSKRSPQGWRQLRG